MSARERAQDVALARHGGAGIDGVVLEVANAASDVWEPLLRNLATQLNERILGRPDHPWVPGTEFNDGKLLAAMHDALEALGEQP